METSDLLKSKDNEQYVHMNHDNLIKKATLGIKKGGLIGAITFCVLIMILFQQHVYLLNASFAISIVTSVIIGLIWGGIIGFLISPTITIKNSRR